MKVKTFHVMYDMVEYSYETLKVKIFVETRQ